MDLHHCLDDEDCQLITTMTTVTILPTILMTMVCSPTQRRYDDGDHLTRRAGDDGAYLHPPTDDDGDHLHPRRS